LGVKETRVSGEKKTLRGVARAAAKGAAGESEESSKHNEMMMGALVRPSKEAT